jgi:uncharacterized damage-inducible protein DinB
MHKDQGQALREHLVRLLSARQAHATWEDVLTDVPPEHRGATVEGAPHTLWQLLEHLRIAQWDILEFSRDAKHVSPEFPKGYWPTTTKPPDEAAWEASVARFRSDLEAMVTLVSDPSTDLFATIPHGSGQTVLREAMLVADHNAYHLGQMVFLKKMLGSWRQVPYS